MQFYALHGFLGLPTDWQFLSDFLTQNNGTLIAPELYSQSHLGLWEWAVQFNQSLQPVRKGAKRILTGYSMGGRLALHALLQAPSMWDAAILISAHPGHPKRTEVQDLQWVERFTHEPWDKLMRSWENQSIFQNDPQIERLEQNYSRKELTQTLVNWSKSKQEDLTGRIAQLSIPLLWIAGEKDSTYATIARDTSTLHQFSEVWIAPNAGHRVPWCLPELTLSTIAGFLGVGKSNR